ncbi:hypothetical protein KFE80_00345 [bacterium SCSIO 12696]|nr:hypothetical protein KFE80_00345 [bacterium SCSIO 12696]
MNKILLSISVTALISVLTSLHFTSAFFRGVIQEKSQEERLQVVAFSQFLFEDLDSNDIQSLRKRVNRQMTAALAHPYPENSYKYMYSDACKIHQLVYEYRIDHPEQYKVESPEEIISQRNLEYWSKKDCGA